MNAPSVEPTTALYMRKALIAAAGLEAAASTGRGLELLATI
jgi:hypothetical protein